MFNEELKKRYIIQKESTTYTPANYLNNLFSKTEEFEVRLGKDISRFTVYEIIDFYKTLNMMSVESLGVMNSHLALYTDWCLKQNIVPDCQNHFTELKYDNFLKCINVVALRKSIVSRETLYSWLGQLTNPSDAFVMLALFEGIKGKEFCEIANLKLSDFSGNKVKLITGRELTVSDKLVELAKESDETMEYYAVNPDCTYKRQYKDVEYIVKTLPNCKEGANSTLRGRRIYFRFLRNLEFLGVKEYMRPNSFAESGQIDYINRRSKELGMTASEFIYSEYISEVDYRFSSDLRRTRVAYCKKFGEYLV